MLRLQVTRPEELVRITDEIHDWFFDVDDVAFDASRSEVVVPFGRPSTDEATAVASAPPSRVRRILGFGRNDAGSGVVTIKGNIPVTITVGVRRLDVSVEETGEATGS